MHKLLLAVAVLGMAISGHLLIEYQSAGPMVCLAGQGCDTVRASRFSSFFGLPTPSYGLAYYLVLGVMAAVWTPAQARLLTWSLSLLTGMGLTASAYLTYLEAFVIAAWCSWCVISAVLTAVAFWAVWFNMYGKEYLWKLLLKRKSP